MPAAYAHYRFGQLVLSRLPEEKQNLIQAHRALYDLGLQGPDPLIFDPRTQKEARRFHKVWEQEIGRAHV